jgi:hypothetical protein
MTQGPRRGLLWAELREATRAAHAQAEASLAPLAQPDSLARYAALLCVLWGFQAPLERWLGRQELPSAVGWPARQRLGALAADLADLGVTGTPLPELALPEVPLREAAGLPPPGRPRYLGHPGRPRCRVGNLVRHRRGDPGRPGAAASRRGPPRSGAGQVPRRARRAHPADVARARPARRPLRPCPAGQAARPAGRAPGLRRLQRMGGRPCRELDEHS